MTYKKDIDPDLYEFMTYLQLKKGLESGDVFVKDSVNYRSLNDELIPEAIWKKGKEKILKKSMKPLLRKPIADILSELKQKLDNKYAEVNNRITSKQNQHIKIDVSKNKRITWSLPYKCQEDTVNNPFYEKLPLSNISDVIRFVETKVDFLKSFSHIQPKYAKTDVHLDHLIAYIIGNGTGIGKGRIAEISDISLSELEATEKNFIRLETLRNGNDSIINHIAKLPIFKHYNLSDYGIHASLDGQKIESKYLTIKARHSGKYFGRSKGVVSYTLVANHVPINSMIIGANEHESHYVLDIVLNNSTDVDVRTISGDMHSINRVNFFLLYMFGYWFAPRLTSVTDKAEKNLVSFANIEKYKKYMIKPSAQVKEEPIISEWDNILRILATLAGKDCTQSTIVKKLSSYKSLNSTLKAMIELDKIIMTLYVLEYVDDVDLRSTVYRALNRGEEFHQLRSAILKVSGRKIIGRTEMELSINNECNRFLANCIVYFNASILSNLLELYTKKKDKKMCDDIKRLSPVAWQHINLVGNFEFCTNKNIIDLTKMTDNLAEYLSKKAA